MLYEPLDKNFYDFEVKRDQDKCIQCTACINQCSFEANFFDTDRDIIDSINRKCVGCRRCEAICPTDAITIKVNASNFRPNDNWKEYHLKYIYKQANYGGALLGGAGNDKKYKIYWDHLLLDASQVTNPAIDPLREPMELRTFLGKKPDSLNIIQKDGKYRLKEPIPPQLHLNVPIMFAAMSYGALNLRVHKAMAQAAREVGTYFNTGEGGLHPSLFEYKENTIVQVASGRFGVYSDYLEKGSAIEIKIGQGAKPGIGGHLPGEKVTAEISALRMIPVGSDALSPAPQHDIYSIEDLKQLIFALKEATRYKKPISVKVSAVHNIAPIASGITYAGADIIVIDGFKGGTGAAPIAIRDNTGIPIEMAVAAVDDRLRQEGIRNKVSIVASGGIRSSTDVVKAIALGANAVYIGTAALIAVGCTLCQQCHTGKCPWGITTNNPTLIKRINVDRATEQLINLLNSWALEIKEILGSMGINAIESLQGNREKLRALDLTPAELQVLKIKQAGR